MSRVSSLECQYMVTHPPLFKTAEPVAGNFVQQKAKAIHKEVVLREVGSHNSTNGSPLWQV